MSAPVAAVSSTTAGLASLAGSGVLSGAAARDRTMSVLPAFAALLPQAVVQRGSVLGCTGSAAVSLSLALAAGPSAEGAWVGVVGLPSIGVAAAVELGVAPERLVLVAEPVQRFDDGQWADVLATMIDGFDVVVVGPGARQVRAGTARRLLARLQARGAVLVSVGSTEPFGADFHFQATRTVWQGLGSGHGVAHARHAQVQLAGRRVPRPRQAQMWLPGADGRVQLAQPDAPSIEPTSTPEVASPDVAQVVALRRAG